MRIVNHELNIDLPFEKGVEPKDLLRRISSEPNAAGSIGLISLRSLLNGDLPEVNGYLIMTDEDDAEAQQEATAAAELAAATEAAEVESDSAAEAIATEDVVEGANVTATDAEAPVETTEEAPVETSDAEAAPDVSAKEAVQKAFGINVQEPLTPKPNESTGVSRPRRDMSALIAKAKSGVHAKLLEAVEAAGYTIVNVENSERWFGFNVAGGGDQRNAPRFDVSPLKNGAYSVSLYVNDRATKIKERLVPAEGGQVTPEQIIASMQGEMFKDAIAEGLAALTKAAE